MRFVLAFVVLALLAALFVGSSFSVSASAITGVLR